MNTSTILALSALMISLLLGWRLYIVSRRVSGALGSTTGDLEAALVKYHQRMAQVDQKLDALTVIHEELKEKTALASQKISVVRFNPFGDTGGDQSFALAVLDDHSSGYILTSIHGRTGTRVYVKPIDFGKSKYNLSVEEQQALTQAMKRTPKKESP